MSIDPNRPESPDVDLAESLMSTQPLILIVEDDTDNREGYAEYLSFVGFRVAQAQTGEEALSRVFDLRPDIMLLDLALPGIDGWEVARVVKNDPRTRNIPVIALSACVFPGDVVRAANAGCDSFLDKPCYPEQVADEIRRVLNRRRGAPADQPTN